MDYAALAGALLDRLNQLRANPLSFVPALEAMLPRFSGKLYKSRRAGVTWITDEGRAAVLEAVEFLRQAPASRPLRPCALLEGSAAEQARRMGAEDGQAEDRGEGLEALVARFLSWEGALGESVCFEECEADEILAVLLVEDGNPARTHRQNLLRKAFKAVGVAAAPHRTLQHVAVLHFAEEVAPLASHRPETAPRPAFDADEMPPEAVSCSVKKSIKTVGNRRTVRTVKTYKMRDGSQQVVEEIEEETLA